MRWMDNYLMDGNQEMPDYKLDHKAKLDAIKAKDKKADEGTENDEKDSD